MPVQVFCRYFITQWNTLLFVKAVNSELSVTVRDKEGVRVTNKIRFDHRDYFEPPFLRPAQSFWKQECKNLVCGGGILPKFALLPS